MTCAFFLMAAARLEESPRMFLLSMLSCIGICLHVYGGFLRTIDILSGDFVFFISTVTYLILYLAALVSFYYTKILHTMLQNMQMFINVCTHKLVRFALLVYNCVMYLHMSHNGEITTNVMECPCLGYMGTWMHTLLTELCKFAVCPSCAQMQYALHAGLYVCIKGFLCLCEANDICRATDKPNGIPDSHHCNLPCDDPLNLWFSALYRHQAFNQYDEEIGMETFPYNPRLTDKRNTWNQHNHIANITNPAWRVARANILVDCPTACKVDHSPLRGTCCDHTLQPTTPKLMEHKWPHGNARSVLITQGIEPHPGPANLTIRLQNVCGGGRLKGDALADTIAEVTALTEYELTEFAVLSARTTFGSKCKQLLLGQLCSITKESERIMGRRVGLAIHQDLTFQCPDSVTGDGLDELRASGRWLESTIFLGTSSQAVNVAVLYGISGASAKGKCHDINERLLALATSRAISADDAPYLLMMDANVQPEDSATIQTVVREALLIDVCADRHENGQPPNTYQKGGIKCPSPTGENTSRIDVILANAAANLLIVEVRYLWDKAITNAFDHVPIDIILGTGAFTSTIDVYAPVRPIKTEELCKLTPDQAELLYYYVCQVYSDTLEKLQTCDSPTDAHKYWSELAEVYLRAWQTLQPGDDHFEAAVIEIRYLDSEEDLNEHNKKRFSKRGEVMRLRTVLAISRIARGAVKASNFLGKALCKTISRCRAYANIHNQNTDLNHLKVKETLCAKILRMCRHFTIAPEIVTQSIVLTAENIDSIMTSARTHLKRHVNNMQSLHTADWKAKLCTNWRTTSAKAFFRYLRNDSKVPLASFMNPSTNTRTCEPREVDHLFHKQWHDVYNDDSPPNIIEFLNEYSDYCSPMQPILDTPFTADELQAQALRFANGSARGVDGWAPAELKILPFAIWKHRVLVETIIFKHKKHPDQYRHVTHQSPCCGKVRAALLVITEGLQCW